MQLVTAVWLLGGFIMEELKRAKQENPEQEEKKEQPEFEVEEKSTDDLADWIEEQGIQLRY